MSIIQRVQALNLPNDQYIVIGSGILDAYKLREADDIDLAVTPELFSQLAGMDSYKKETKDGAPYLIGEGIEVWLGWGEDADFAHLKRSAITINDILFVNPEFLIKRKQERGTEKDLRDIKLLKEYLYERK